MTQDRYDEKLAFAVVAKLLATTVEPYDRCGRQAAVDAILHYPDGRTAALEVSSIGSDTEDPILNFLGNRGSSRSIPGVSGKWLVELPRNFHPANIRKIEEGLRTCEMRGVQRLTELVGWEPLLDALLKQGVRGHIIDATGSRAYFVLSPIGGASDAGLTSLPEELDTALRTSTMHSKIVKLAATGLDERHLFLMIRSAAFSYPVFDALAWDGQLPAGTPTLPGGLSQVWLLPGVRTGGVVRAISGHGWYRDDPYDGLAFLGSRA
jgi:hypothetical protein